MSLRSDAYDIIAELSTGQFYIMCPCCDEKIRLKDAGLFFLDEFTDEAKVAYDEEMAKLKELEKDLRNRKKQIPEKSQIVTKSVNIGFILERLAPCLKGFCFDRNDCRSLFDPIDYIIFEGLRNSGKVSRLIFTDIKTGNAQLKKNQREIKNLVENKKVDLNIY
ncbi:MAG: hypothetical protein GX660_03360 [Clostridiaceae bacterium]|nr:hypothetical protein [Clostridiaceae bacterium]